MIFYTSLYIGFRTLRTPESFYNKPFLLSALVLCNMACFLGLAVRNTGSGEFRYVIRFLFGANRFKGPRNKYLYSWHAADERRDSIPIKNLENNRLNTSSQEEIYQED